jgi:transcriptional regulator with XRE-family HTH domain
LRKNSVEELAARGCTIEEIAGILGVNRDTVSDNFSAEVARGRNRLAEQLRGRQVDLAMNGSVPLLIWLGKQYLGQSDRQEQKITEEVVTIERIAPKIALSESA